MYDLGSMPSIHLQLADHQDTKARELARKLNLNRSAYIRRAVEEFNARLTSSPNSLERPLRDAEKRVSGSVANSRRFAIDNDRFYRGSSGELIKAIAPMEAGLLQAVEHCLLQVVDLPTSSGQHT